VKTILVPQFNGKYLVCIKQDGQSFRLEYKGTKAEAQWYAKMFRKALDAHNAEMIERYFKGVTRVTVCSGHHRKSHDGPCEPGCYYETTVKP
jgi:hypothetical protein